MTNPTHPLYCTGCGKHIADAAPGMTLAISCACGASAPILDDGKWEQHLAMKDDFLSGFVIPASLVMGMAKGTDLAHLEYYLGYSDHTSIPKEAIIRVLEQNDIKSQLECDHEGCREDFEAMRQLYQHRQEREASLARIRENGAGKNGSG